MMYTWHNGVYIIYPIIRLSGYPFLIRDMDFCKLLIPPLLPLSGWNETSLKLGQFLFWQTARVGPNRSPWATFSRPFWA